MHREKCKR